MTRDEADAALRSMIWGAKTKGDSESLARLEALRAELPNGQLPSEWGDTFTKLLEWAFPAAWARVDASKLHFAFAFDAMCREAVAKGELPRDVQEAYGRTPHFGSLGNVRDVAGAFAIARGYRPKRSTLNAARGWAWQALELGEQAGVPIIQQLPAGGQSRTT